MHGSQDINQTSQANSARQPSSLPCTKKVGVEIWARSLASEITLSLGDLERKFLLRRVNFQSFDAHLISFPSFTDYFT